jgi:hypothetical protein
MRSPVLKYLTGGDRRSIGGAERAARLVTAQPSLFKDLLIEMFSNDLLVCMRAADAVEKVTRRRPHLLQRHKEELLVLAEETAQKELQWHLAQMLPRLELTAKERRRAAVAMEKYLESESSIVRACALQALYELSGSSPGLRARAEKLLLDASRTGTPAMRARARKLLVLLRHQRRVGGT